MVAEVVQVEVEVGANVTWTHKQGKQEFPNFRPIFIFETKGKWLVSAQFVRHRVVENLLH